LFILLLIILHTLPFLLALHFSFCCTSYSSFFFSSSFISLFFSLFSFSLIFLFSYSSPVPPWPSASTTPPIYLRFFTLFQLLHSVHFIPYHTVAKIWSWVPRGLEPSLTVLERISRNLAVSQSICSRRSQWPLSLRQELSSLARTLGSWVRIPIEAWMSVLGIGLATAWPLVQGVLTNVVLN
jgi:hypothetical protein